MAPRRAGTLKRKRTESGIAVTIPSSTTGASEQSPPKRRQGQRKSEQPYHRRRRITVNAASSPSTSDSPPPPSSSRSSRFSLPRLQSPAEHHTESHGTPQAEELLPADYRDGQWPLKGILKESKLQYLVDWADHPVTGEIYENTWEYKENVGWAAIDEWKAKKKKKATRKRKRGGREPNRVRRDDDHRRIFLSLSSSDTHSSDKSQSPRVKQRRKDPRLIDSSSSSPAREIPETQPIILSEGFPAATIDNPPVDQEHSLQANTVAAENLQNTGSSKETAEEDSTLGASLPPDSPVHTTRHSLARVPSTEHSRTDHRRTEHTQLPQLLAGAASEIAQAQSFTDPTESISQPAQRECLLVRSNSTDSFDAVQSKPAENPIGDLQTRHSSNCSIRQDNGEEIDLQPITEDRCSGERFRPVELSVPVPTSAPPHNVTGPRTPPPECSINDSPGLAHSQTVVPVTEPVRHINIPEPDPQPRVREGEAWELVGYPAGNPIRRAQGTPPDPSAAFFTQVSLPDCYPTQPRSPRSPHPIRGSATPCDGRAGSTFSSSRPSRTSSSEAKKPSPANTSIPVPTRFESNPETPADSVVLPSIEVDMPASGATTSPEASGNSLFGQQSEQEDSLRDKLRQLRSDFRENASQTKSSARSGSRRPSAAQDSEVRPPPQSACAEQTCALPDPLPSRQDEIVSSLEVDSPIATSEEKRAGIYEPHISRINPSVSSPQPSKVSPVGSSQRNIDADGISQLTVSTLPLLQQNEFVVPLPVDGRIKHQYLAELQDRANAIEEFVYSASDQETAAALDMNDMLRRLNDTLIHTDLGLQGPATQIASTQEETLWAEEASMKFAFLGHLIKLLRGSKQQLVVVAQDGPIFQIAAAYFKGRNVNMKTYTKVGTPTELHRGDAVDTACYHLMTTSFASRAPTMPATSVVLALDDSFSTPNLAAMNAACPAPPVLRLWVVNSAEHVARCIPTELPARERARERARLLVRIIAHVSSDLGDLPSPNISELCQAMALDAGSRLTLVKKDQAAKIEFAARQTAGAMVSGHFAANFQLPPIPELELEGLDDLPPSDEESRKDEASSAASRAGTPAGRKRSREDASSSAMQAKRPRLTTLAEVTHISDSMHDASQPQTIDELKKLLATTQQLLVEEREERKKVEEGAAYTQTRLEDLTLSLRQLQHRYEKRMRQVHRLERDKRRQMAEREAGVHRQEKLNMENENLKEQRSKLECDLTSAREELLSSPSSLRSQHHSNNTVPATAELESHRAAARAATEERDQLRVQKDSLQTNFDFLRSAYQEASTKAVEHAAQVTALEAANEELRAQASDERRRLKEINTREAREKDLSTIEQLLGEVERLKRDLTRAEEENRFLMTARKGRGGGGFGVVTRSSSAQPQPQPSSQLRPQTQMLAPHATNSAGGGGGGANRAQSPLAIETRGEGIGGSVGAAISHATAAPANDSPRKNKSGTNSGRRAGGDGNGNGSRSRSRSRSRHASPAAMATASFIAAT